MLPENALTTPVVSGVDQRLFRGAYRVGMLGGGQLGRMLIQAGLPFNLAVHVLDPQSDAPCRHVCHRFVTGDFSDHRTVVEFGRELDLVTLEIEHVDVDALETLKAAGVRVCPDPALVRTVQDKGLQKQMFQRLDIPTAAFVLCDDRADVARHKGRLPGVLKLRRGGYDGRGVMLLGGEADLQRAFDAPSVLEARVDIAMELSFIVARSPSGEVRSYPPIEMVFDPALNLVDYLVSPARVDDRVASAGRALAQRLAEALDLTGILAVETFLTPAGDLLVNEIAPRPHNSGHHTIEGNVTSQFEQHLRAVLDLPLGDPGVLAPAVTVNLVGAPGPSGEPVYRGMRELLAIEGAHLHLYGKGVTRPGRKMGHVTVVAERVEDALAKAMAVKAQVAVSA